MTDPRMTTPDAPVTVEQCDREAGLALRLYTTSIKPGDYRYDRMCADFRSGGWDDKEAVQAFARHRLAALASAPAGDGAAPQEATIVLISQQRGEGGYQTHGIFHSFADAAAHVIKDEGMSPRILDDLVAEWRETDDRHELSRGDYWWVATREKVRRPHSAALARPRAAVGPVDDDTCTGCDGSGFDPIRETVCHCQPEQSRAAVGERDNG